MSAVPISPRVRKRRLLVWGAIACVFVGLSLGLVGAVDRVREAAARSHCNMGQIALAFHNYQDEHGSLPPAVVYSPEGRPLHSWRVLLLPYLEEQQLYSEFKLDEPWNSEHNLRLLDRMPRSYVGPKPDRLPPHHTLYHVLVGPGTPFEPERKCRVEDFAGGPEVLMFVEAGDPTPWTKPEDIAFDPNHPPLRYEVFFATAIAHARSGVGTASRLTSRTTKCCVRRMVAASDRRPSLTVEPSPRPDSQGIMLRFVVIFLARG